MAAEKIGRVVAFSHTYGVEAFLSRALDRLRMTQRDSSMFAVEALCPS
jgi:hypothetical protein